MVAANRSDPRGSTSPLDPREDPSTFIETCFTDPHGERLKQAKVHLALQDFLSRYSRALVELPRDHGKSFQICARVLWELAREPALRVKVVCATEAVAAERSRFLREAIETNTQIRVVS